MQFLVATDIFATKGPEYLLVITFLALLVLYWRSTSRPPERSARRAAPRGRWFELDTALSYHPGHGWARVEDPGRVTLGLDDFAQKLVGTPSRVELPRPGTRLVQGGPGATLHFGAKAICLPSPVDGEVVERNADLATDPGVLNREPYAGGWLMKVRPTRLAPNLGNLLRGSRARAFLDAAESELRARLAPGLGPVLQDGGLPITGIAPALFGDRWDEVATELLTGSAEERGR